MTDRRVNAASSTRCGTFRLQGSPAPSCRLYDDIARLAGKPCDLALSHRCSVCRRRSMQRASWRARTCTGPCRSRPWSPIPRGHNQASVSRLCALLMCGTGAGGTCAAGYSNPSDASTAREDCANKHHSLGTQKSLRLRSQPLFSCIRLPAPPHACM